MDCTFLNWVIPGIFGITGTLTGVFLANFYQERKERRDAYTSFYRAFTEMIYFLRIGEKPPIAFIPQAVIAHEIAKNMFRRRLRENRSVKSFDTVWEEYHSECEKYYKPIQLTEDEWAERRKDLLNKLNKLLAIAEQN